MPNLNNEGLAIAPQSECVAGKKEVLWADDGDTGGNSLRRGAIDCTTPERSVSGVVTTEGGAPLAGACVYLYTSENAPSASYASCSVADGSYYVGNVAPGDYVVAVADPSGAHETLWVDDPLTVDGVESGYDLSLSAPDTGHLVGDITEAGTGADLGSVCAFAYPKDDGTAAAYATCSSADGSYGLYDIDSAEYDVAYFDPSAGHLTQWWTGANGGAATQAGAVAVAVPAGGSVTANAVMDRITQGVLSGTVTDQNDAPVAGVCVYVYTSPAGPAQYATCTQADGTYWLGNVQAGSAYRVGFADPSGVLATQWWTGSAGGSSTYAGGAPVTVAAGQTTSGVSATMSAP
jgi:hypothetical protein